MRKNSKCNFIKSKCASMKNGGEFWQTVCLFILNKTKEGTSDTVLRNDDDTIVSDKLKVCSILNDYFASVAKDIGKSDELPENDDINDIVNKYENHDSVQYISTRLRSGTKVW